MNVLWFTRQTPSLPGVEVIVAGTPVPPCFVPSDALVAVAAVSGLGVHLCDPEDGLPTEVEMEAADDIFAALAHLMSLDDNPA